MTSIAHTNGHRHSLAVCAGYGEGETTLLLVGIVFAFADFEPDFGRA